MSASPLTPPRGGDEPTQPSPLTQARALDRPTREATLRRDHSVSLFWEQNTDLLAEAWREWEADAELPILDETLLDERLRETVAAAWEDPTRESAVKDLWEPVVPGVFQTQFFDPERLQDLRAYLDATVEAGIPVRAPYGIVLNRYGAMLDRRSSGYLAAPAFQSLYERLIERYMRPISRLLFPEIAGYDSQSFGFSIQYQPGMDTSIQPHTDASATTLNINMNLPGETFAGSGVDFYDHGTGRPARFVFESGVAALHRGGVPHAAHPITEGERTNLVLWLYGEHMGVPPPGIQGPALEARERWAPSVAPLDRSAPF